MVRALVAKALEHLLHNGQAGDQLVELGQVVQLDTAWPAEDLDPDRGVDEDQGTLLARRGERLAP
jgi:hypothetical protein